jgi:DNA-directed RNA polymerase subunit omega
MIDPSINDLMMKVDSRFTLCIITSKRARKLVDGANSLVKCSSEKPVTVAVNELNEGKLTYVRTKSGIK